MSLAFRDKDQSGTAICKSPFAYLIYGWRFEILCADAWAQQDEW